MPDPLWSLSATRLADLYRRGAATPTQVLEAVLGRLETVNKQLNAVVASDVAAARDAAAAATARWTAAAPLSPLDGVPFTVKDNIPTAGFPTRWGSPAWPATPADRDELPIARLRDAGAVVIGKTNVPEFTSQGYTDNAVFGTTGNPWDPRLTPGGSSGGAVAAVAAGIGPFAIGTDGGGSIRRPASHTGLFGLKPSRGRVPRCDGLPAILLDFEVIGPIARSVADLVAVMQVVAPPHPRDPLGHGLPAFTVPEPAPCRVLYVPRFGAHPVDPEVAASTDAVAAALGRAGHAVTRAAAPFDPDAVARIQATVSQAGLAWLGETFGAAPASPTLAEMQQGGARLPAATLFGALDAAHELRRTLSALFDRFDLILTPAAAALPWPAAQSHPPEIDGVAVGPRGHAVFTAFANIAGLPGLTLPGPHAANGLPIGAQLLGPIGADGLLLAIAGALEAKGDAVVRWPPLDPP
ncbi:MAG: amidase [Rhodospirillales bacterium]|nr:amidase [Rhodospirillales bacterium]